MFCGICGVLGGGGGGGGGGTLDWGGGGADSFCCVLGDIFLWILCNVLQQINLTV